MTDEQLSALLRLKRHEIPPPGYFDRLLADVHRRQRAELLQRPLWKIAFERFQTFFGEHSMGPLSYAGAVASVVGAGALAAIALGGAGKPLSSPIAVAPPSTAPQAWTLPSPRFARLPETPRAPRYIIDARPVSYERPSSF